MPSQRYCSSFTLPKLLDWLRKNILNAHRRHSTLNTQYPWLGTAPACTIISQKWILQHHRRSYLLPKNDNQLERYQLLDTAIWTSMNQPNKVHSMVLELVTYRNHLQNNGTLSLQNPNIHSPQRLYENTNSCNWKTLHRALKSDMATLKTFYLPSWWACNHIWNIILILSH